MKKIYPFIYQIVCFFINLYNFAQTSLHHSPRQCSLDFHEIVEKFESNSNKGQSPGMSYIIYSYACNVLYNLL